MADTTIALMTSAGLPLPRGTLMEVEVPTGGSPEYASGKAELAKLGIVSTLDANASIPASSAIAGVAVTSNYQGDGAVNFWNLVEGALGFSFFQKTGPFTGVNFGAVFGDATFSEFDVYGPSGSIVSLYANATVTQSGSTSNTDFEIISNNTTRFVVDKAGGMYTAGATGGAQGDGTISAKNGLAVTDGMAIGSLPTPGLGMMRVVTDALAPAVGAVVAAGGSAKALVWYNGSAWTVMGK